jgi:drug/metabolite transporter (DMT)-like permease
VQKQYIIHLKLLFVAAIWGASWTAGRIMALDMPPITGAWLRYLIAIICFLIWLKIIGLLKMPTRGQWKLAFLIGFFSTAMYQAFFMFGMKYTAAGDASLMITFNPLFTALLAIPLLSEKMTARLATGLGLGVSGGVILFLYSPNVNLPADERIVGNLLIAFAALSWAFSSILMRKAMSEPTDDASEPLSPLTLTVWASITGFVFLTPWAGWETIQDGIPSISARAWWATVFLAVISTVIAYVWFANGIKAIGAGKAALYVYLVPPFGILSGWLLLDERLGWSLLFAFVLIVGGVALAQSEKRHQQVVSEE